MNAGVQTETATISSALRDAATRLTAARIVSAGLDAEILLAFALGIERGRVYMNGDRALVGAALARFRALVSRRADGEPVSYIIGRREFWSLDFIVTPAVLTPRPETELLVEAALKLVAANSSPRILELGTGSGAIAVALAKEIPGAQIVATDISTDALKVARENARRHGVENRISFVAGDLFDAVAQMTFDAIASNPPYIRDADIAALPRDVRGFEPLISLDGGADGMDFYRRIAREAPRYLNARGFIAVEIGACMGANVARLFAAAGFADVRVEKDLAGLERVVSARAAL
ncbi:MAG TPA: peptide chain release factor N(5)-glutamine methyltransferase [Candidatus Binatia bacterium]|nr:peptide chain release factor N(5)-glutamine methyltransferase [Candidatus Binatia bacterium]